MTFIILLCENVLLINGYKKVPKAVLNYQNKFGEDPCTCTRRAHVQTNGHMDVCKIVSSRSLLSFELKLRIS